MYVVVDTISIFEFVVDERIRKTILFILREILTFFNRRRYHTRILYRDTHNTVALGSCGLLRNRKIFLNTHRERKRKRN